MWQVLQMNSDFFGSILNFSLAWEGFREKLISALDRARSASSVLPGSGFGFLSGRIQTQDILPDLLAQSIVLHRFDQIYIYAYSVHSQCRE